MASPLRIETRTLGRAQNKATGRPVQPENGCAVLALHARLGHPVTKAGPLRPGRVIRLHLDHVSSRGLDDLQYLGAWHAMHLDQLLQPLCGLSRGWVWMLGLHGICQASKEIFQPVQNGWTTWRGYWSGHFCGSSCVTLHLPPFARCLKDELTSGLENPDELGDVLL